MAVDFPSTLYKEHIPLLISTIPTNKRQTPNIIFSPLLFFNISFCLYFASKNSLFNTHNKINKSCLFSYKNQNFILTGLSLYRLVSSYKSSHKTS